MEIPADGGSETHLISMDGHGLLLDDLFIPMHRSAWGRMFFQELEDGLIKVKPGYLMVLDRNLVQSWQANETPLMDGQHFKLIRVVPGG